MGCCVSKDDTRKPKNNSSVTITNPMKGGSIEVSPSERKTLANDKTILSLHMNLRGKRFNVFNEGLVETITREVYEKTPDQIMKISTALNKNYIFAGMKDDDMLALISSMKEETIEAERDVIVQGDQGDYFYVIEEGCCAVLVDGNQVHEYKPCSSFGEIALLYDAKRQATIRTLTTCIFHKLDRQTFQYSIAMSASATMAERKACLRNIPILSTFSEDQITKLCDAVIVKPYEAGEQIIKKGEIGLEFFIVKEGICVGTDFGEGYGEILFKDRQCFGERALIRREPRAGNIYAKTKVVLFVIDKVTFDNLIGPLASQGAALDISIKRDQLRLKLFQEMAPQEFNNVTDLFQEIVWAADTIIEDLTQFYVIRSGSIKVGDAVLGSGGHFGSLFEEPVAKIYQTKETTEALFITKADLEGLVSTNKLTDKSLKKFKSQISASAQSNVAQIWKTHVKLNFSDLERLRVLGSGMFGRVELVRDKVTKKVYALKGMSKSFIVEHKQQKNVLNEKAIMMECNCPFILKLYQTFRDKLRVYMLLELVQGGELFSVLHPPSGREDGVSLNRARFYGAGVAIALEYMHCKNIAYRDMKPENCLIDAKGYPKVIDFGFSKRIENKSFTLCGTPEYLAPEIILSKGHTKSVDYWAFGVLLFEMVAGESPFADPKMDQRKIFKSIMTGKVNYNKLRYRSDDLKDLISKLLVDSKDRLGNLRGGPEDIRLHRWFSEIDFNRYFNQDIEAEWKPKIANATDCSNFEAYDDPPQEANPENSGWDNDF